MRKLLFIIFIVLLGCINLKAQKPYRVGTTAANFLDIGYGSDALGMGEAYVSVTNGLSSVFWNPAGLGYMENSHAHVSVQPWFVDVNTSLLGFGYVDGTLGTFAFSVIMMNYSEEEVTTVALPDGTGEFFDGSDLAVSLSYGKRLADWFSFGMSLKYITSSIWHQTASAVALDFGAIVNTSFFQWTGMPGDGLNIGMSISNYGTRLTFDGIDLKQSVDILPGENGNFANIPARFELDSWELPLIFRLGISVVPYMDDNNKFILAVDAIHPNNNSEYLNVGLQYTLRIPTYGTISIRSGYRSLFMVESEYGLTMGLGMNLLVYGNQAILFDYAYRSHNTLGDIHSYSIGYSF